MRAKGHRRDLPFDHSTGVGMVKAKSGKYSHALSQGARVAPLIVETTGAISPRSLRFVSYLTRRARGKHARDDTRYGRNRMSATSYYVHHTQRLSRAAAWGDVNGIHESVTVSPPVSI